MAGPRPSSSFPPGMVSPKLLPVPVELLAIFRQLPFVVADLLTVLLDLPEVLLDLIARGSFPDVLAQFPPVFPKLSAVLFQFPPVLSNLPLVFSDLFPVPRHLLGSLPSLGVLCEETGDIRVVQQEVSCPGMLSQPLG